LIYTAVIFASYIMDPWFTQLSIRLTSSHLTTAFLLPGQLLFNTIFQLLLNYGIISHLSDCPAELTSNSMKERMAGKTAKTHLHTGCRS